MIVVSSSFTPVVVVCDRETGPDYLVYTTHDRHTVICEIYSVSGTPYFSTRGNFCLSQDFVDEAAKQVGDLC